MIFKCLLIILLVLTHTVVEAQDENRLDNQNRRSHKRLNISDLRYSQIHYDSVDEARIARMTNTHAFYDSIRSDSNVNFFMRTLARAVVTASKFNAEKVNQRIYLANDERYFNKYTGKKIRDIRIIQSDIFAQSGESEIWIQRVMDDLHALTKQSAVRQNLLFKSGDTISPLTMNINENLLRDLPYLSSAHFVIDMIPESPNEVDIWVFTRDNWSISADIRNNGSTKQRFVDVFDKNFLGYGNELIIRNYLPTKYQGYALEGVYNMDNLWGTFISGSLRLSVGETNNIVEAKLFKPYVTPSSSAGGFSVSSHKYNSYLMLSDTIHLTMKKSMDVWLGKSFMLSARKGTAFFISSKFGREFYPRRIEVSKYDNPYYHNRSYMLVSLGVSRENYYQGNYIFGFSRIADIPYGFKIELNGGYEWGEFQNRYYVGGQLGIGDLTRIGYFSAMGNFDTYISRQGKMEQGNVGLNFQYFTNLHSWGRYSFRQFLTVNMTMGMNRYNGEREILMFDSPGNLRGMRDRGVIGTNRFVLRGESVVFTPYYIAGFQMAFFGYGDFGWLGDKYAIFDNSFRGVLGLGVRIKNERLVFKNIQLRFGFILHRGPESRGSFIYLSNEEQFITNRFKPVEPMFREYH